MVSLALRRGLQRHKDHLVIRTPGPARAALGSLSAVLGSVAVLFLCLALCPGAAERALGLLQVRQGHALQGNTVLPFVHTAIEPHPGLAWKGP